MFNYNIKVAAFFTGPRSILTRLAIFAMDDSVLQSATAANHHHFHRPMPESGLFVPIVGHEGRGSFLEAEGAKYEIIAVMLLVLDISQLWKTKLCSIVDIK